MLLTTFNLMWFPGKQRHSGQQGEWGQLSTRNGPVTARLSPGMAGQLFNTNSLIQTGSTYFTGFPNAMLSSYKKKKTENSHEDEANIQGMDGAGGLPGCDPAAPDTNPGSGFPGCGFPGSGFSLFPPSGWGMGTFTLHTQ